MPYDDNSKGDCHYYNDYGDGNYAKKSYPFDITSGKDKSTYVNDLFINGTVYAGGDRGDPTALTVDYDYISVYGTSHIFVNGTGYATGTNVSDATKAMYIQGSLFGSGNSCSTFYVDKNMSRFITLTNYNATNELNQYIIYSIQRTTNVTLISSSIRLPGRSDGSNPDVTALYSLNHVNSLTLRSGSTLILDTIVQDLRNIYSKINKDSDEDAQLNTTNIIRLNNGISLIVAELQIHEASISGVISDNSGNPLAGAVITFVTSGKTYSAIADSLGGYTLSNIPLNTTGKISIVHNGNEMYAHDLNELTGDLTINFPNPSSSLEATGEKAASSTYIFGEVNGYFKLDIQNPKYYGGYIYGELYAKGGFIYGETFKDVATGTVPYTDYASNEGGYRVWKAGGTHQSSTTTLIADGNKSEKSTDPDTSGYNTATGSASLPMTTTGTKYKLVGYTIYPSQATSISRPDEHRSLTLLPYYGAVGGADSLPVSVSDVSSYFGLHMAVNPNSFKPDQGTEQLAGLWIDPNVTDFSDSIYESPATTIGGTTLPELDFTLYYKDGVNVTGSAGTVIVFVQEMIPFTNTEGNIDYLFGDEIQISVSIETQSKVENHGADYEQETHLYPSTTGEYSWNFVIPPVGSGNGYYDVTLNSITSTGVNLNNSSLEPTGANQYQLIMSAVNNQDGSEGWDGFATSGEYLTSDSKEISIGRSDGRFNTSIEFTLKNEKDLDKYATGTVTAKFAVKYYANGGAALINSTLTLTIHIENRIPVYTVIFETGTDATVVPYQRVEFSDTPYKPVDPRKIVPLTSVSLMNASNPGELVFLGWENSDGNIVDIETVPVVDDTTYTAVWAYKLTFDHNDGSGSSTVIYYDGEGKGSMTLVDPSRTGYIFKGWYESEDSANAHADDGRSSSYFNNKPPVTQNDIYYAGWEEISYTIKFDYNNGKLKENATDPSHGSVQIGGTVTLPEGTILSPPDYSDASKSYKFNGWSLNRSAAVGSNGGYTLTSDDITTYAAGDTLTFYAIWSESDNHNVTISANPNGSADFKYVIHEGNAVLDNPTYSTYSAPFLVSDKSYVTVTCTPRSGYGFTSWDGSSEKTETITVQISSDTEIKAKLTGKTYTVTFEEEGVVANKITVQYGQAYSYNPNAPDNSNSFPANPTKNAYEFKGWYSSNLNETVTTDSIVRIAGDHTLTAQFNAIDYTIIFHSNASSDTTKQQIFNINQEPSTYSLPQNLFAYEGHTFSGWNTNPNGLGTQIPDGANIFEINADDGSYKYLELFTNDSTLNLYAQWKKSSLTITVEENLIYDGKDWRDRINNVVTSVTLDGATISESLTYKWFTGTGTGTDYVEVSNNGVINAGTYYVMVTHTTVDGDEIKSAMTKVEIGKRSLSATTVTFTVNDLTYAGGPQNPTFNISENVGGIELIKPSDYDFSYTYPSGKTSVTDVGEYTLILTATKNGNYTGNIQKTFEVNPLGITITPVAGQWKYYGDDFSHIYGTDNAGPNDYYGYTITFKNNDGIDIILDRGELGITTEYVSYDKISGELSVINDNGVAIGPFEDVGNYNFSLGSISSSSPSNYDIILDTTSPKFEVKPLPIIIKPDEDQWKFYGDPDTQIYTGNYPQIGTPNNNISYKIIVDGNATPISPENWNTTYPGYAQLEGIKVSYDNPDDNQYLSVDTNGYDTTLTQGDNPNYKISLYGESDNTQVKFMINPLPIFIVPLEGQWKYYGYDLTKLENFDNSDARIFIGEDTEKVGYASLQYEVYTYKGYDKQNAEKIQVGLESGYAALEGRLLSEMLRGDSSVYNDDKSVKLYTFYTSELRSSNNPNYSIYSYDSDYSATLGSNVVLSAEGAQASTIPTSSYTGKIEKRPTEITWSNGPYTYNGKDQISSVTAKYVDKDNTDQILPSSITSPEGVDKFLIAGDYAFLADLTGSDNYDFGNSYKHNMTMDKIGLTISITNLETVYDGNKSFEYTNSNLPSNIVCTGTLADGDNITKIKISINEKDVNTYTLADNNVEVSVFAGSDNVSDR